MARKVAVSFGSFGGAGQDMAWSGMARSGKVRQLRLGSLCFDLLWHVPARHGTAVEVGFGLVRFVRLRQGQLWQFWFVRFRSVAACSGIVRQLWQGKVRLGMSEQG